MVENHFWTFDQKLWLAGFEADFGSDSELLDVEDDVVEVSEDLIIEICFGPRRRLTASFRFD